MRNSTKIHFWFFCLIGFMCQLEEINAQNQPSIPAFSKHSPITTKPGSTEDNHYYPIDSVQNNDPDDSEKSQKPEKKPISVCGKFNNSGYITAEIGSDYINHLSESICFKTISNPKQPNVNGFAFLKLHQYIKEAFPLIDRMLKREIIHKYSLLYIWKGQNPKLLPVLLIAHLDVVPVDSQNQKQWLQEPFSGIQKEGFIWGRGSMDDKVSVFGILEAVEALIKRGYQPMHDVYLAFGDDEETFGDGSAEISKELKSRGLKFKYILDEGGGILEGSIPYVKRPIAFIGIAEKGYLTVQLSTRQTGGHSSMPVDEGVVGILAKAIYRLQENPFQAKLTPPVKTMFRELGKYIPGINGFIAMHPAFFKGFILKELSVHPITNALVQTTLAPTMMESGLKDNMIPSTGSITLNIRIIPGETIQWVLNRIKRTIHDKRVAIEVMDDAWNPSRTTSIKSKSYKILKHSIEKIFPSVGVVPTLNVSISDSRNYAGLSNTILHFVPIIMHEGDGDRIHGLNERISETNYRDCIRFYFHFILDSDSLL